MSPEAQIRERALTDILRERIRQIRVEGWSLEHDDEHDQAQLARAALSYALSGITKLMTHPPHAMFTAMAEMWPWERCALPRHQPRQLLVIGAALLVAEIERLDRAVVPNLGTHPSIVREVVEDHPSDRIGGKKPEPPL